MSTKILQGNCFDVLKTLPDESVNCCVTSPPYWGLRDYGTASWSGGDSDCDHLEPQGGTGTASAKQNTSSGSQNLQYKGTCKKCGAIRQDAQIGIEDSPDQYVENLVTAFREVRRTLRADGTLWLNLGDSYAGNNNGYSGDSRPSNAAGSLTSKNGGTRTMQQRRTVGNGLKNKDLVGIPWMVAFALRADGWYLRSDIIWHKTNPMPESIKDRPTKSHEYLFLLSKSAKYYYDQHAIKEPVAESSIERAKYGWHGRTGTAKDGMTMGARVGNSMQKMAATGIAMGETSLCGKDGLRNRRTVWTIGNSGYKGAHFATYPKELVRPCILAGSPVGGVVLDPFGGSGTTGEVANEEGRDSILIELNESYIPLMERRTGQPQQLKLAA